MGPLKGIKVIEFAGLGPAPMAAMLLADLGADVIRIERTKLRSAKQAAKDIFDPRIDILNRNRRVVTLNIKHPQAVQAALRLVTKADILLEGFRPGVMERIGLGPDTCLEANPQLVYGRMTGWGQTGPLANTAGHDINYLSLSGGLHAIGAKGKKPVVPLNLVADCGGGAMLLAFGVLAALVEARNSGSGQVVDAAMTDGSAILMSMIYTLKAMGTWSQTREDNLLDGGAHFYNTYECLDKKWLSVGAIEPQFYALFLEKANISDPLFQQQWDKDKWPELTDRLANLIKTRTRDEWCVLFEDSDACVTPVLDMDEAPNHPHNLSRGAFIEINGVTQPAPAPRFSRTPPGKPTGPLNDTDASSVLYEYGFSVDEINALSEAGALG